ncbi:MAG TPA: EAL domain-containing protein [Steroidobacteraceae bacterium]
MNICPHSHPGDAASAEAPGCVRKAVRRAAERRTVLLIDGCPQVHAIVEGQLRDLNLDVYQVNSGSEALLQLGDWLPDLVLVDCQLPDFAAMEMLQKLHAQAHPRPISIIFLTSPDDDSVPGVALEEGAVEFLRKPLRAMELRARVRAVLNARALLCGLEYQARHDSLTGLLNRDGLLPRIEECLSRVNAGLKSHFALLVLDFDHFKQLNDAYGHDAGDDLLRQAAARVCATTRIRDLIHNDASELPIARLGGDEFAVLLEDLHDPTDAEEVAKRLIQELSREYSIDELRVASSISIGIVHGSHSHTNAGGLLRDGDAAMYEAKAAGRGCHVVFDSALRRRIERKANTERELRLAVESQQLTLAYQPIINLESGRFVGLESLLRWQHPKLGAVSPADFIPVAVNSGLIGPIGDWVLKKACIEFKQLQQQMGENAPDFIAVNVSRRQLTDTGLPAKISAVLAASGIDPKCLHLEITESELVTNLAAAKGTMREIKRLGVALSVDDFGTGYSSLASLYDFPIDVFKLDRSFIAADLTSERGRALMAVTHAVLQLARNIGVRVIAEGVETFPQLAVLQSLRCDMAQGYLLGRPMPLGQILAWSRTAVARMAT